jgi:hypothetical protein
MNQNLSQIGTEVQTAFDDLFGALWELFPWEIWLLIALGLFFFFGGGKRLRRVIGGGR